MKTYRTSLKPGHPDIEAFFDTLSVSDRGRFLELALVHYAHTIGKTTIENILQREVFVGYVPRIAVKRKRKSATKIAPNKPATETSAQMQSGSALRQLLSPLTRSGK